MSKFKKFIIWTTSLLLVLNASFLTDLIKPEKAYAGDDDLKNCQISPRGPITNVNTPTVSGEISADVAGVQVIFFNVQNENQRYIVSKSISPGETTFLLGLPYTYFSDTEATGTVDSINDGIYKVVVEASDTDLELLDEDIIEDDYTIDTQKPTVSSVTLSDPSPTKAGNLITIIEFNEKMDESIDPSVSFGLEEPYNQHQVSGYFTSPTTWQGIYTIDSQTGEGLNTLSVSSASDLAGNIMETDTGFQFEIDTIAPPYSPTDAYVKQGPNNKENVINSFNQRRVTVVVTLPPESLNEDFVVAEISDGINNVSKRVPAILGAGSVEISGLDVSSLLEGALNLKTWVEDLARNPGSFFSKSVLKDTRPPATPVITSVTSGDGYVDLNWNSVLGAVEYQVWRASSPFEWIRPTTTETSFKDTTVVNGVTYYYQIRAVDEHGNISPLLNISQAVSAKPVAPVSPVTFIPPAKAAPPAPEEVAPPAAAEEVIPPVTEEGKILGVEEEEQAPRNWTPVIIIGCLIILFGVGYFGWKWYEKREKVERW